MVENEPPDVLLLDIMMPHVSGLDILAALRADQSWVHLPVVILTAATDQAIKRPGSRAGSQRFLAKPVDPTELIPRVYNVLTVKHHHDHLAQYAHELEAEVLRRTADLARSRQEVIHCLARAAEFRDDDTGRHVFRVGQYARLIAAELGWKGERLNLLEQAAQLHDIGKIGIPDSILLKPGKLEPEEIEIMQKHGGFGKRIMQSLPDHESNVLPEAHGTGIAAAAGDRLADPVAGVDDRSEPSREMGRLGLSAGPGGRRHSDRGADHRGRRRVRRAEQQTALQTRLSRCRHASQILEEGRGKHFDPAGARRLLPLPGRNHQDAASIRRHALSAPNVPECSPVAPARPRLCWSEPSVAKAGALIVPSARDLLHTVEVLEIVPQI